MANMFNITASTGEYADKCRYNVFVCISQEDADTCLRAIDNWFALMGIQSLPALYHYTPRGNTGKLVEAFKKQFGVLISIDYTGVVFESEPVEVFNDQTA